MTKHIDFYIARERAYMRAKISLETTINFNKTAK